MIELKEWHGCDDHFPRVIDFGKTSHPADNIKINFQGSDIQCVQDLPQFLILGNLEKESFHYCEDEHHTRWDARWRGFDPESFVEVSWDSNDGWSITITWFGSVLAQVNTKEAESFADALKLAVNFEKNVFNNPGHLSFECFSDGLKKTIWSTPQFFWKESNGELQLPELPFGKRVVAYIPIHAMNLRRASEIYQEAAAEMLGGSEADAIFSELTYYQKDVLAGEKLLSAMDLWKLTGALVPGCMLPSPHRCSFVRHGYVLRICCAFCDLSKLSALNALCIKRLGLSSFYLPEEFRRYRFTAPEPTISGKTFFAAASRNLRRYPEKKAGKPSRLEAALQQAEAASLQAKKLALALMKPNQTLRSASLEEDDGPAFVFYNQQYPYAAQLWRTSLQDGLNTPGPFHVLLGAFSYDDWAPCIRLLGYFDHGLKEEELVLLELISTGFYDQPLGRINTQKTLSQKDIKTLGKCFGDPKTAEYTLWTYEFFFGQEITHDAAVAWARYFYDDESEERFCPVACDQYLAWKYFSHDYEKLLRFTDEWNGDEEVDASVAVPWMINRCTTEAVFDDLKIFGKIWQTKERIYPPKSTAFTLRDASMFLAAKCPRYQIMDPKTWSESEP